MNDTMLQTNYYRVVKEGVHIDCIMKVYGTIINPVESKIEIRGEVFTSFEVVDHVSDIEFLRAIIVRP